MKSFLKTLFFTRSLWRAFGLFWLAWIVLFVLEKFSIFLTPDFFIVPFFLLSGLCATAFIAYRKEHPQFLANTEHYRIMKSGTTAQRFGVFWFVTIFFGPLGAAPAVLILAKIWTPGANLGQHLLLMVGFCTILSASLAAWFQANEFEEPKKTTYKGILCWLYIIFTLLAPVIDYLTDDSQDDIAYSPALIKAINDAADK